MAAIVKDSPKFHFSDNLLHPLLPGHWIYEQWTQPTLVYLGSLPVKGTPPEQVAEKISAETGLLAITSSEFRRRAVQYVVENTGIPVSFGTVIGLGIIVGISVVGLMFNLFVLENLRHFAVLKAIGVSNLRLLWMVFLQAPIVGFVGYGFGLGAAAMFFQFAGQDPNFAGFYLPWQVGLGSGLVAS